MFQLTVMVCGAVGAGAGACGAGLSVVCAPCGFDLEGSVSLSERVRDRFPGIPVWAVDANASFARPGPRLVDGIEALAGILNPGLVPARDDLAQELRKSYRSRGRNREKLQRSEKIP